MYQQTGTMKIGLWAVEWNYCQKMPHIEPLSDYIRDTKEKCDEECIQEWLLIDVAISHDEASKKATKYEQYIASKW